MSSITFQNDVESSAAPTPNRRNMPVHTERNHDAPTMHEDDAAALRIVSSIIFAVVALATLAMIGTVLICL